MTEAVIVPEKPGGSYRLLHTADWHLGKLLNDRSREEEHALFLEWLLNAVRLHSVDAILLAGDVFDSANPPQSALRQYFNFVSDLFRQGSCALVVIAGNHDSAALLESPKQLLRALNTHVTGHLAALPEERVLRLPNDSKPAVAIALLPFLRDRDLRTGKMGESADDIRGQLVAGVRQRYAETAEAIKSAGVTCPVIATGHLTVQGSKSSDSERDIHIGGLGAVASDTFSDAFAYVALGHLHRPQSTGGGRVCYAGSPIALSFSESADCKSVRILDVTADGVAQHALPLPIFRHLLQIRTDTAGLGLALKNLSTKPGELRSWLEVVVEDATLADDLNERVRNLVEGQEVDLLKVMLGKPAPLAGMTTEGAADDADITSQLDQPARVFEHLLGRQSGLDEGELANLRTTFALLLDMDAEAQANPA